jgi:hypothetical protein
MTGGGGGRALFIALAQVCGSGKEQLRCSYRFLILRSASVGFAIAQDSIGARYSTGWAVLVPVGIGIASPLRLYDRRIISRTLSYILVVSALGAVFAVGAIWIPSFIVGEKSPPLFVAGSTLVVAGLFNPVRRRVQAWVDRRFNRSRYDTERVMDGFAARLRDEVDPQRLVDGWVEVVDEAMQPSLARVWLRT